MLQHQLDETDKLCVVAATDILSEERAASRESSCRHTQRPLHPQLDKIIELHLVAASDRLSDSRVACEESSCSPIQYKIYTHWLDETVRLCVVAARDILSDLSAAVLLHVAGADTEYQTAVNTAEPCSCAASFAAAGRAMSGLEDQVWRIAPCPLPKGKRRGGA
jgi:hypothetical protein